MSFRFVKKWIRLTTALKWNTGMHNSRLTLGCTVKFFLLGHSEITRVFSNFWQPRKLPLAT